MAFSVEEIKNLMDKMKQTGLGRLEVKEGDYRLTLSAKKAQKTVEQLVMAPPAPPMGAPMTPPPAPLAPNADEEQAPAEEEEAGTVVRAPIVGTFYSAPSPDKEDFVRPGQAVKKGDVLFIIESMKVMNEIKSQLDGTVGKLLVKSGDPVEYDQPVLTIC